MDNELEFDVKVEAGDLRRYMFCHKYMKVSGILEILIGLACLIIGVIRYNTIVDDSRNYMLFLIFFGVYFLIISPIQTFMNSARQYISNPTYNEAFHYVLGNEGITISQGEDSAELPWGQIYKVTDNGTSIIIYISKFNANILPKACFADKVDAVKDAFRANVPERCVRL